MGRLIYHWAIVSGSVLRATRAGHVRPLQRRLPRPEWSEIGRSVTIAAIGLLYIMAAQQPAKAFTRSRTNLNGNFLFRKDNNNLQFRINDQTTAGLTSTTGNVTISADSTPIQALQVAMTAWSSVTTASITFLPPLLTSVTNSLFDNQNVITFADTPANRSITGDALAVTNPTGVRQSGEIIDADILFNPKLAYSTTLKTGTYDIQTIATHELGHTLGVDHSGLLGATMFFAARQANALLSMLTADDVAFASSTYPRESFAAMFGSISGAISLDSGSPVVDALVTAADSSTGIVVGAVSAADGSYTIAGVPPGHYMLYAEPMDGPVMPSQFGSIPTGANTNFTTTFLGGNASPQVLTVTAGQITTASLTVAAGTPLLNITLGAAGPVNGITTFFGGASVLYPGQTLDFAVVGHGLNDTSITENTISFLGAPITIQKGSLTVTKTTSGTPVLLFTVQVAPDAKPGLYTLLVRSASSAAVYSGGAKILPAAPAFTSAGVVNAASFVKATVAPGEIVSIFGTGIGPVNGAQGGVDPITGGLVTSLSGVTVSFNGVAAPIFYASATQINAEAPFEVAGQSNVNVTVRYLASLSPAVSVPVGDASPGIFQAGGSQGVVLNEDYSVNGTGNAAARGSAAIVYATGQGAIQPSLATGQLAPLAGALSNAEQKVTAKIGGQTAQVLFAGIAPGFTGLLQVNVIVPADAPTGSSVPLQITIGSATSQTTTTMAVK